MEKNPKFSVKDSKLIFLHLYVSNGLSKNPAKMIKIITDNKKLFPSITDETLQLIMKEHNITQDDINKHPHVNFKDEMDEV